jgi:hypothetical protein
MCGYRCDLCKAFSQNIKINDQREMQIKMWQKYYGGFEKATIENTFCEGCRCDKPDAKRIDTGCKVRKCVIDKGLLHCGQCSEYPCDTFNLRAGLTFDEAKQKLHESFSPNEYNNFILAFDNKGNISEYRNQQEKQESSE